MPLPPPSKTKRVKHHAALPWQELPAFMAELRQRDNISAKALEFTILTAARTGETIGSTWAEVDLDAKVWTVPAARMKAQKEHRVPLSDRAVEILRDLPRVKGERHVFPGSKAAVGLSNMSLLELLRGMRPGLTVHGFRSTFKDWCSESTNHPNIVSEAALAHTIPDKVEKAYRRGELLEKRKRLMRDWSAYCTRPPITERSNVAPLRKA
jgi:integrase